ncbi:hypothetical protein HGO38_01575 [Rhizobium sp. CG5]|uniref:hypothetical protein n=1 Tax=Rhizobium sp. CG5 TaxID=2726076 RepID=UPI002034026A|nr:hypothetical protein [Rhizobium sp. CG5]MCM2472166.1 hypothetical protein [Rhizobium sp. CG5]
MTWTVSQATIITAEQKQATARAALINAYSAAIQAHMDATAKERLYDGIQTAVSYRDDPNPQFAAEANALFTWRSAVWTYATTELDAVLAGTRAQPSIEAFVAELPGFTWP